MDLSKLNVSNGNGEAVRALVTVLRAPGATVITPNSLVNWPTSFIATTGPLLADGTLDPAKTIVFWGHIVGSTIVIDQLAPGYTDTYGSAVGDVVVIKPNTWGQDTLIDKVKAMDTFDKTDPVQRQTESLSNFVVSGGVWSTVSGLNGAMTALTAYINGYRNTITAIASRTFTASKDTYVDVLRNTTTNAFSLVYTEVANNAAAPTLAANSIRLAKVVTNGSAITSVIQTGRDSLTNSIKPVGAVNQSNIDWSSFESRVTQIYNNAFDTGNLSGATAGTSFGYTGSLPRALQSGESVMIIPVLQRWCQFECIAPTVAGATSFNYTLNCTTTTNVMKAAMSFIYFRNGS